MTMIASVGDPSSSLNGNVSVSGNNTLSGNISPSSSTHQKQASLEDAETSSNNNSSIRMAGKAEASVGNDGHAAKSGESKPQQAHLASSGGVTATAAAVSPTASSVVPAGLVAHPVQTSEVGISRSLLIQPHAAAKVIKGEIHNVLTVMRSHSYVSPNRFVEEFTDLHPVAHRLHEMHAQLAAGEYEEDAFLENNLIAYISPFCDAVQGRDISAPVTGAALSALHKFLLYGFVTPEMQHASEIMTLIAESLVHCQFEEESDARGRRSGSVISVASASVGDSIRRSVTSSTHGSSSVHGQASFHHLTPQQEEEQVVLKLLDLSALTVRCSLQSINLISAKLITGLLETCLHVSHRAKRASPLLKSAAADALGQMVLQVFAGSGAPVQEARLVLLKQLAELLNSSSRNKASSSLIVTQTSLTLVNIALETCREEWRKEEMDVLQNDVCKYLLSTSTSNDLMIQALTLRVIFNLFDSMRNHLKVQLEVFLTSVHLRILETSAEEESREVVLESLLEFCQEPALMQDIYLNYDCDVACTNLYESVVSALGKAAVPAGWNTTGFSRTGNDHALGGQRAQSASASLEGVGAPIDAASEKRAPEGKLTNSHTGESTKSGDSVKSRPSLSAHLEGQVSQPVDLAASAPLTLLNRLSLECLLSVLDSIVKRQEVLPSSPSSNISVTSESLESAAGDDRSGDDRGKLSRHVSHEELLERKMTKHSLSRVAEAFNADPMGQEWMELAVAEGQLDEGKTAKGVAKLFTTAPGFDKVELGIYLSKGPDKDYPFQAEVRKEFVSLFDFRNLTFAAALRKFLSRFRLPGEAQCIDRLMEAFSHEMYKQEGESSFFKNADSVYVLAFSTIMLNTDLHNPTIKQESRMTLNQFVRNNRGINGGEDLPEEFLTELYEQIKAEQIQVRREMGEIMTHHENNDFRSTWESILAKKGEVTTAFFTDARDARRGLSTAGLHDKDMFEVLCKWLLPSITGAFLRSWDDALVVRTFRGMKSMAKLAAGFELDWVIEDLLQALLPMGRDYIMGCVSLEYADMKDSGSVVSNSGSRTINSVETGTEEDDQTQYESEFPIPFGLLSSAKERVEPEIYGSASHRGILALDCSFVLLRKYGRRLTAAWPYFVECLCALRDARALPAGLADLDDFADSNGNVLPLSVFARASRKRLDDYYRSKADPDQSNQKGWFRSLWRKSETEQGSDGVDAEEYATPSRGELSMYAKTLLGIAESADVENVIQVGSTNFVAAELTIRALLDAVAQYPYGEDPVLEQHSIFSLELAVRALLSNKDRASDLFPIFLESFEIVLGRVDERNIIAPFVLERIVVTVLRACIHLYEIPELRPHLRTSLHLIMMTLPKSFIRQVADRMACGLAIILRTSFQFFETANEWAFMGDTLDSLAQYTTARVFVFDGIASTVEYALSSSGASEEDSNAGTSSVNGDAPTLTTEACTCLARILIRFMLGFYQNDLSLSLPAMLCLEKVYGQKVELLVKEQQELQEGSAPANISDPLTKAPDAELWQNYAVAIYSVCRSTDAESSLHAADCYERVILRTAIDQIPDEKWIAIVYLMVNKQPPVVAERSRANAFSLLTKAMGHILPVLSHNPDNKEDLEDLVSSAAGLAGENLRLGRRGRVSPVFEKTRQALTDLSNRMVTDDWKGEKEFSAWASETLLSELEKVGAAGASLKNQEAVKPSNDSPPAETTEATETEVTADGE